MWYISVGYHEKLEMIASFIVTSTQSHQDMHILYQRWTPLTEYSDLIILRFYQKEFVSIGADLSALYGDCIWHFYCLQQIEIKDFILTQLHTLVNVYVHLVVFKCIASTS